MPRKPTSPFGALSFSRDGQVTRQVTKLSEFKTIQEKEVMNIFQRQFNNDNPTRQIIDIKDLPENDQDFLMTMDGRSVLVQLTELSTFEYYVKITQDEYESGRWTSFALKGGETIPYAIDTDKMVNALRKVIEKKINKNYSKGREEMWLLVFTTDSGYLTEYIESGQRKESLGIKIARDYVSKLDSNIFKEIWFTNLQTRPIKI